MGERDFAKVKCKRGLFLLQILKKGPTQKGWVHLIGTGPRYISKTFLVWEDDPPQKERKKEKNEEKEK